MRKFQFVLPVAILVFFESFCVCCNFVCASLMAPLNVCDVCESDRDLVLLVFSEFKENEGIGGGGGGGGIKAAAGESISVVILHALSLIVALSCRNSSSALSDLILHRSSSFSSNIF